MKQDELETGTLGFVEVPSCSFNHYIHRSNLIFDLPDNKADIIRGILDGEDWQPLSLFSQLKEEDVKEVMPNKFYNTIDGRVNVYIDFINEFNYCKTAIEAIHSLAQHLGLNAVNPYGIEPNIDEYKDETLRAEDYLINDLYQWQEAQSKVKPYFVVFKPKE